MKYRCVASSPEGLVQLLAASYLRHGYFWYVTGRIKGSKDPAEIDRKLVDKYQIALTARERARRKELGIANMHYVRYDRWFILLATEGNHAFKQQEKKSIRDCRRVAIKFAGYSISYRRGGRTPKGGSDPKWHAHVRIDTTTYSELRAHLVALATHRSAESLAQEFRKIGFARYAPIRRQLLNILRAANAARSRTGYESIPHSVLNLRRTIVPVYAEDENVNGSNLEAGQWKTTLSRKSCSLI